MAYTQEQLKAMNTDQLIAEVMALQGQQSTAQATDTTTTNETTVQAASTDATAQATPVQTDIDKIEAKIASLKQDGEELYAVAIAALEAKRDALVAQAKAEINQAETEVKSFVNQFRDKYLPWVEGIAVLVVLLKVFGVI